MFKNFTNVGIGIFNKSNNNQHNKDHNEYKNNYYFIKLLLFTDFTITKY
jgi:hypothetical protein